ncbi:hypothetical protein VHARVF571_190024 [Vibrio harveyi]|nr:hypothetical protein VHARVF571_190024 [Vibrio harveyi]
MIIFYCLDYSVHISICTTISFNCDLKHKLFDEENALKAFIFLALWDLKE